MSELFDFAVKYIKDDSTFTGVKCCGCCIRFEQRNYFDVCSKNDESILLCDICYILAKHDELNSKFDVLLKCIKPIVAELDKEKLKSKGEELLNEIKE